MRRVIATQRNFVFGSGFRKLAVFCPNLIRCCVRSAVGTHPCARRLSVALRSQGRSLFVLLPFSFPDRHSAKRDGGLLLPCPRGDRPPGNVPDGMSKSKCHALPARQQYFTTPPLQMTSAGFLHPLSLKIVSSSSRFKFEFECGVRGWKSCSF